MLIVAISLLSAKKNTKGDSSHIQIETSDGSEIIGSIQLDHE